MAVFQQLPLQIKLIQIQEVIAVFQLHLAGLEVYRFEFDVLVYFLHFDQFGSHLAVGSYDTVTAEIEIVRFVAETTAEVVTVRQFAIFVDTLVHPVPDTTAYHTVGMVFDIIPIFVEVADRIPHRVCIFAKEERFFALFLILLLHRLDGRIHTGIHIGDPVLTFVVDRTRIELACFFIYGVEVLAVSGLITHRPENDGRVVLVALDHADHTIYVGGQPAFLVADRMVAMTLYICFVHYIEAIVIVQCVHLGVVRIMARTDRIQVIAFEKQYILDHRLDWNRFSMLRMDVVAIGPFEEDLLVVDIYPLILDLDFTETKL